MRKWIVEFLRQFESRGDKIAPVTQFASPNLPIYFNLVRDSVRCDRGRFSVHSPFIKKTMVLYKLEGVKLYLP